MSLASPLCLTHPSVILHPSASRAQARSDDSHLFIIPIDRMRETERPSERWSCSIIHLASLSQASTCFFLCRFIGNTCTKHLATNRQQRTPGPESIAGDRPYFFECLFPLAEMHNAETKLGLRFRLHGCANAEELSSPFCHIFSSFSLLYCFHLFLPMLRSIRISIFSAFQRLSNLR
jgi:hypothetical protein